MVSKSQKQFFSKVFWSITKVPYPKNVHNNNMLQGSQTQDLGQSKYVQTDGFLKKTQNISKIISIYESLASLESKIRRCPSFL